LILLSIALPTLAGLHSLKPSANVQSELGHHSGRGNNLQISRNMTKRSQKSAAQKLRSWRASLILGEKAQIILGFVDAPDRASAEAAAVKAFNLDGEHRIRLAVQERE
jgi:hypothetical protein